MGLYLKECRKVLKSVIYFIFVVLVVVMWYQDFYGVTSDEISLAEGSSNAGNLVEFDRPLLAEPSPDDDFFGMKTVENPDKLMVGAVDKLLGEYEQNLYATYPLGYYKAITLSVEDQGRILDILCEITGLTEDQLTNIPDAYFPSINGTIIHFPNDTADDETGSEIEIEMGTDEQSDDNSSDKTQTFIAQVSYKKFKELMDEAESIIGKGSNYSLETLIAYFGWEDMTYEEALEEYSSTINDDEITGGFARLFCDYLSKAVGLFPIFLVVFLWLKDRRTGTDELIYSRKISSGKLIFVRYFATLTMAMIPVILLSFESLVSLISFGAKNGLAVDCFAYIKYIFWWLIPTAMIVTALGLFLTVLTDSPIAILIQFLWWFIDSGITGLSGDTAWFTLMIRHNTLRGYDMIQDNLSIIWFNRLFFAALSLLLLMLSTWILNKKRRGKIDFWRFYSNIFRIIKTKLSFKHTA